MGPDDPGDLPEGCSFLKTNGSFSTDAIRKIADQSADAGFTMIIPGKPLIILWDVGPGTDFSR